MSNARQRRGNRAKQARLRSGSIQIRVSEKLGLEGPKSLKRNHGEGKLGLAVPQFQKTVRKGAAKISSTYLRGF